MEQSQNNMLAIIGKYTPEQIVSEIVVPIVNNAPLMAAIGYNQLMSQKFVEYARPHFDNILKMDLANASNESLKATDEVLEGIMNRSAAGKTHVNEKRKPITEKWNSEVLKKFTAAESVFDDMFATASGYRSTIAKEINRRQVIAAQQATLNADRERERISFIESLTTHALNKTGQLIPTRAKGIIDKFYAFGLDKFEKYVESLRSWPCKMSEEEQRGIMEGHTFTFRFHDPTKERLPEATAEELQAIAKACNDVFFKNLGATRDTLLTQAPKRLLELKSGITDGGSDQAQLQAEAATKAQIVTAESVQSVQTQAVVERSEASYVAYSQGSAAAPEQAAGTSKVMELKPVNHGQWETIIKYYMQADFQHLSMEELEKKFGFMRKKVQSLAQVNGVWPVGVPVEEDFKNRRGRKAAN